VVVANRHGRGLSRRVHARALPLHAQPVLLLSMITLVVRQ